MSGKETPDLPETKACTSKAHFSNSPFPRDKVPIKEFIKEMAGNRVKMCNTCSHCRNKRTGARVRKANERKEENVQAKQIDPNFGVCTSECHEAEGVSKYPRNKVPSELFLGRTKDKTYEHCLDCRTHIVKIKDNTRANKKLNAAPDEYVCKCGKTGDVELRATNLDGTPSSRCIYCKETDKKFNESYRENRRILYKTIKLEKIKQNECCCQKCKSIFLKSSDKNPFVELKTYVENEIRYVQYLGETYTAKEFLDKFTDMLELKMIEFDHLTEKEQRERNIIQPHEAFIEKKGSVTELRTAWDIKDEAKITQILCCICHMKETISREGGRLLYGHAGVKSRYVNELKTEKLGCEMCNFFDPTLLRYLEFDHINPELKVATICEMVYNGKYTLDDIIAECRKCRLLCKMCHRLHTSNQIQEGLFDEAYRGYPTN